MKEIPLTNNMVALVDDEDYDRVSKHIWRATFERRWYASTRELIGNSRVSLKMHRLIMNVGYGDPEQVDHRDENGLNNQKYNLRFCTISQNLMNRGKQKNNTTGFKGVSWNKVCQKFDARLTAGGQQICLGLFKDPKEAALAWNIAAIQHHGEFAYQNPI